MKSVEQLLLLGVGEKQRKQRFVLDTIIAAAGALLVTGSIYLFKLYPKIPNISFLYLLVVLALASTRGLYAAIITSLVAFLSFDYFLVLPLYTFTISKFEEWLALVIFLLTSIITGQLASALRQRAEQATQRERETRALYELVSATTVEENLERQLGIVAHAIVDVFTPSGVRDCAILLPGISGKLTLRVDAFQPKEQAKVSSDEEATATTALKQGKVIDLYYDVPSSHLDKYGQHWLRRPVTQVGSGRTYVRMIPLRVGGRGVGVVRLLLEEGPWQLSIERDQYTSVAQERLNPQTTFFWTFLDQATAVIEHARLHQENMQVELLKRTDVLRSALLSSVSHDLRTPLSSIKAAASSLLQQDVQWDEEERRSFALAIKRQADRLNRLVGNLLDMTRIEGGALKPEKEWYPVDELINDVLGHMQFVLQGREVHTTIADGLPPVQLDYLQIDQVLTNLIENAVRYTPADSPIEVDARVADEEILISIADRGPGIPVEDLERIFDKFYRVIGTSRRGSIMGSGLGLAVCRGLVEAHGGHIWAENREGGGAVFRFTLPLEANEQVEEQEGLKNG